MTVVALRSPGAAKVVIDDGTQPGIGPTEPSRAPGTVCFCPGCLSQVPAGLELCPRCKLARPEAGWPLDPNIGRVIKHKYRIEERLGAGGFGLVFRATQVQGEVELGDVVLKFLHREMAANPEVRKRFVNEARAARQIRSPHAVKIFDLDFDEDGAPFMVMEYLQGTSLQDLLLREGRLPPQRTLRIGLQVAAALDECHAIGIVHRDLKPDNLLLLPGRGEDFVKVLDFGIARVPSSTGTSTHSFIGTPRYMPPEQILQQTIDGGVDIFALGVILYECLAGGPPIQARTPMEYLQLNLNASPTPLREARPEMPPALERLLGLMLAKKRIDRPASMADLEGRLRAIGVAQCWLPAEAAGQVPAPAETIDLADQATAIPEPELAPSPATLAPGTLAPPTGEPRLGPSRTRLVVAGVAIAAAVIGGLLFVAYREPVAPPTEVGQPDSRAALDARRRRPDAASSRASDAEIRTVDAGPASTKRPPRTPALRTKKQSDPANGWGDPAGGL